MDAAQTPAPTPPGEPRTARSWLGAAALVAGGWTFVGLFGIARDWALSLTTDRPARSVEDMWWTMESVWLWALFTPLIFALCRRFPLERGRAARNLAVHAALAVGVHLLDVAVDYVFGAAAGLARGPLMVHFLAESFINLFSYAALAGIAHAVAYQREAAERRARAAELERQLAEARLQALEAQIHPHFLFNTLNSVAALIRAKEDRAAIGMLVGLGDLLRLALRNRDAQEVTLRDELEFVDRYLAVERIRFQDRLRAEIDVSPDTPLDALVPHLVLQPLVENAIRHGVEARAAAGTVQVKVSREDGMLRMSVTDDGPGPAQPAAKKEGRGIGLGNTRQRLAHLYGARHRFDLSAAEDGGAVATVAVPFRTARSEGAPEPASAHA
jgi:two-component system, LytTR family, sensor kinase